MTRLSHFFATAFIACALPLAITVPTFAGLSRPPESHVRPMPDGRHMLVFLAPLPAEEDEGRMATLPDGRKVDLRKAFPASGYYDVGSNIPIWMAPWDDADGWSVSDDGRYLVRWNVFGDGKFQSGGELSWGLKFYDHGKEVRTYDVAELVDFPCLMPLTSSDWHYTWIKEVSERPRIEDGDFLLETSTHERYRFDVATGRIVEQHRLWKKLARIGIAAAVVAAIALAVVVARLRRAAATRPVAIVGTDKRQSMASRPLARLLRHSIRTELVMATAIGVLCFVVPRWPHVVVLVAAAVAPLLLGYAAMRYQHRSRARAGSQLKRMAGLGMRWIATGCAAVIFYVLSTSPMMALADSLHAPDDVRMAIGLTVYRPLLWWGDAFDTVPFLRWYDRAWH